MNNLRTFFRQLAIWEGLPVRQLVAKWDAEDAKEVGARLGRAVDCCRFGSTPLKAARSVSSQAVGNRLAAFVSVEVNSRLKDFRIERCRGQGYPDNRLIRTRDESAYALEFKATEEYDPDDTNRMVITCASRKLRRYFPPPVRHLFVIVRYERVCQKLWIREFRLEFLDPKMPVNVRLEGSVTKRMLAARVGTSNQIWIKLPKAPRAVPGNGSD